MRFAKFRRLALATAFTVVLFPSHSLADDDLGENLGTLHFAVSGQPSAEQRVIRGVKLVHHMMYAEADREFAAAARIDPSCALAYWGRAMTLIHPLWPDTPTDAELKLGAEQIRKGLACPPATARERAYLEVLALYFDRPSPEDHAGGLKRLDPAWAALAERYPDDLDAAAFSALFHLAPARFVAKDKSARMQLEAAATLKTVLTKIPDHPGAQHYKIHAYDSPLLADRALDVCDTYTEMAPDVPHALHMPTHIFTRRGMWDRSIEFNLRSADAARKLGEAAGEVNGHFPHALDYLVYAYLQRGQYERADAVRREMAALRGPFAKSQNPQMAFAFSAIPARCALERAAWHEAAQLPLHQPAAFTWSNKFLNGDSIVHFARGIGAARSGRRELARREIAELERLQRELARTNRVSYWASQAETQLLATRAWTIFDPAQPNEALALMRRAVELEMSVDKEAVTPGEVLPAGDLLGDMLLEAKRPTEALAAFEAVLAASPNRLNSLYGAGVAAEQAGDASAARRHFEQLVKVTATGDPGNERVEHARAFVTAAARFEAAVDHDAQIAAHLQQGR